MNDEKYLVALYAFTVFGPKRTRLLVDYFGSAKSVWKADKEELVNVGLTSKTVDAFISYRNKFDLGSYFGRLSSLSIGYTTYLDEDYPKNLSGLEGAPCVLYCRGEIKPSDINAVAIVGTRKMTSYGREVTSKFSTELSSLGVTIVSGLALGIDAQAHKSCLEVGGRAIAVLASGLDIITPASNYNLACEIVRSGGAIVSECPLGTQPLRMSFPVRNRIISGLSKAVLVIEGARKSGTLLTASAAAEQGRPVFAVPGQITSPMSEAPHYLIQNGAKMAVSVADILEELNMQFRVDWETVEKVMPSDEVEEKLLGILENEQMHMDEISRVSSVSVNEVSAKLTMMELKGMVKNIGGGVYKK